MESEEGWVRGKVGRRKVGDKREVGEWMRRGG